MFSKKYKEIEKWTNKAKKYKIPEIDSFINVIERE